jgi:hypothetical protein
MNNLSCFVRIFLLFILGIFSSCTNENQKTGNSANDLPTATKIKIAKEIMDLTDQYAANLNKMDFERAVEMYDASSELMFAENGAFFANRDSLYHYMINYESSEKSFDFQWDQRIVVPVFFDAASLAGSYSLKITLKTGDVFLDRKTFTGVFVRKNSKWVLIHGQESSEVMPGDN